MNIIPQPQEIKSLKKTVYFNKNTVFSGEMPQTILFAQKLVADIDGKASKVVFVTDGNLNEEEYKINCNGKDILVSSSAETGAFYAVMTLAQLANGIGEFEAVEIADKPKFGYRGFMLDCARHFFSMDKIKQILDVMASIKMNIFHWHLSEDQGWRAEIKKYPLLTEKGAIRSSTALSLNGYASHREPRDMNEYGRGLFYTQEDMKAIVAYAQERHINVIPEIDMPGHLVAAIACYPELSCQGSAVEVSNRWGVMDNIACVGKESTYKFLFDVIDELCEIFPYKYFHIGGDEVPKAKWEKCPQCQAIIKEKGLKNENELQGHFNNQIAKHLKEKGKTMIGWNEILDGAEVMDKEIVAQYWTKRVGKGNLEFDWMKSGGKLVLSLVPFVYMDHPYAVRPLAKTYSFSAEAVGIKDATNVLGMEAPQWTEYIRDDEKLDLNTYARLIAMSEVCWTNEDKKDYQNFEKRLEKMRPFFGKMGVKIAPQQVYRGKTVKWYNSFIGAKWNKWRNEPNFEVGVAREIIAKEKN